APAAALLQRKIPGCALASKVVCVISGGNIDVNLLSRIIERGLVKEGRRVVLKLRVPDRPGALAAILTTVATEKANVLEVHHDRAFVPGPVGDTEIELTLETKGASHAEQLVSALTAKGYAVTRRGERRCGIEDGPASFKGSHAGRSAFLVGDAYAGYPSNHSPPRLPGHRAQCERSPRSASP